MRASNAVGNIEVFKVKITALIMPVKCTNSYLMASEQCQNVVFIMKNRGFGISLLCTNNLIKYTLVLPA